uniref:Uncharacterized protein n=1 Tax=Micrurus spixii TaxID=129469 RepID=A0A2D4MBA7_9SAUR
MAVHMSISGLTDCCYCSSQPLLLRFWREWGPCENGMTSATVNFPLLCTLPTYPLALPALRPPVASSPCGKLAVWSCLAMTWQWQVARGNLAAVNCPILHYTASGK